jgi:predicted PurR-regulated permease PerM
MVPNTQIRQILLLLLIACLFGLIFWNLRLFTPALLGAYTLYVLLRKPMQSLTDNHGWKPKLAAGVLMLLSLVVILLPVNALVQMLSAKLMIGFENSQEISASIQKLIANTENRIGIHLLTPERIKAISDWGVQELSVALNATLIGMVMLLITYIILWFMLTEGKKMEASFFSWLPLKPENTEYVRKELNNLVYSNAIGIPLMGIVQCMAGFLGYWLAGAEDIWFWVFMTFIGGLVPFLGVALAFIPLSLVMFSNGMNGQAVFILVYGLVVIGSVDNLARMWLLNKIGHTHPLVTLFGVIIGLQLFGFIGFIFGPIMIAMFLLLLKLYAKEFR